VRSGETSASPEPPAATDAAAEPAQAPAEK
jgi:hypothetical protein